MHLHPYEQQSLFEDVKKELPTGYKDKLTHAGSMGIETSVKTLENLPWIVRLLLVIFFGIYGNLLRLFRSIAANNVVGMVLAVLLLVFGGFFVLWVVDVIFVVLNKKIWWID